MFWLELGLCRVWARVRVRVRVRGETNCPLGRDISLGCDVVSLGRDVQAARFLLFTVCHTTATCHLSIEISTTVRRPVSRLAL